MKISILFCWLLAASSAALHAQSPRSDIPAYRPGDAVRVTVWQYPDLSGQFDIGEDGAVVHPVYRAIRISGMSEAQAEAEFRRVLERFEVDPQFVVEPLYRIMVSGEVRLPNIYTLRANTTMLQALAEAGGPTVMAEMKRVRLLRGGQEIPVDLTDRSGIQAATRLQSGDQVILDTRRSLWTRRIQPVLSAAGSFASLAYLAIRLKQGR
jgi:protein involved in polysaccharide export with SLBB domain